MCIIEFTTQDGVRSSKLVEPSLVSSSCRRLQSKRFSRGTIGTATIG